MMQATHFKHVRTGQQKTGNIVKYFNTLCSIPQVNRFTGNR